MTRKLTTIAVMIVAAILSCSGTLLIATAKPWPAKAVDPRVPKAVPTQVRVHLEAPDGTTISMQCTQLPSPTK